MNRKFTPEQATKIRRRFVAGGISQSALAREHGVTNTLMNLLIRGVNYSTASPGDLVAACAEMSETRRALTQQDAEDIRRLYAGNNGTTRDLAEKYGVCATAIHNIVHGLTYKNRSE